MIIKFFKRKSHDKAIIALDLGTEYVKAILFTIEEKQDINGEVIGRRGVVKGVGKVHQNLGDMQNSTITDIASIIRIAKQAIRIASDEAGIRPQQLVMGIAGEFIKGATSTMAYKRDDPNAKINVSELRNIVHKLQWKAFAEVRKILSEETGHPEIDVKLINSSIIDVRIDGYKVTNLMGFQGKEVEMSIFNSFAPLAHFEALKDIADDLDLELLSIISEPFALSQCLDIEEGEMSYIFIDVGGGATDIAIIANGSVISTKMFGIGGRTFTKRLSVELNISLQEAERLKYAYTSDKLEQKSKKIINDIINDDMEFWLEGVVLALAEFKNIKVFPSKILLSGGGTYLPEIKDILNTRKWYKKLPFAHTPQATYLNPKNLRNIIDETKKVNNREDIMPLALVNIGVDLAGEPTIVQKVLKKVIGIMKV